MINISHKGNLDITRRFLIGAKKINYRKILEAYGREGVQALASATPVDTGATSKSWGYEISSSIGSHTITWTNSNVVNGVPIAIILQYGHATRNGGFVQGRDYINPALRPIFNKIANAAWEEVTKL